MFTIPKHNCLTQFKGNFNYGVTVFLIIPFLMISGQSIREKLSQKDDLLDLLKFNLIEELTECTNYCHS